MVKGHVTAGRDESRPGTLKARATSVPAFLFPLLILLANFLIVGRLFTTEYTPYLMSTEGTFITLARAVAAHPLDLRWWPLWDIGLPFQNTYLPLFNVAAGLYSRFTGVSPALAIHQWGALLFCVGPAVLYLMAWGMTGRAGTSFLAALVYSAMSPCALVSSAIRQDLGSLWRLRRLHILVYYGEGPHTGAMAMVPLAILFLYLAGAGKKKLWFGIAAGVAMAGAILFNAFGAVILGLAGLCLLATAPTENRWRYLGFLVAVGALMYAWISPLVPPSVVAAIRTNSPTVDGDYRFNDHSLIGVIVLAVGFAVLVWLSRRATAPLRFFLLFAFLAGGVVVLGGAHYYVVPQPLRYQIAFDMAVCLAVVFGGAELLESRRKVLWAAGAVVFVLAAIGIRTNVRYGRVLIQRVDVTTSATYKVARRMSEQFGSQRVMVPGSYSYYFNNFSDTPQVLGGHDPMLPNPLMKIVGFIVYAGLNAGDRDGEVSRIWLKALGARAVMVPGPESSEFFKPFVHPGKFEGLLPVLWREAGDTVYGIPARSSSLAHVVPVEALVRHLPIHGLDTGETEVYLKALDDPAFPEAGMEWTDRHTAAIHAQVQPGQAISVQVTYVPGWRAETNGVPVEVGQDGLGLIEIQPGCRGACEVRLIYDGGAEWRWTWAASGLAMAGVGFGVVLRLLRKRSEVSLKPHAG